MYARLVEHMSSDDRDELDALLLADDNEPDNDQAAKVAAVMAVGGVVR